ncbi:NlpC/P60 family protein [Mordavella massiliensis]|uniref:C40 family peptidase n=1 Tax=Mordavella massiliensis TaxID=1871024 RepID=A0A938XC74_9CLOT|nr:NlpC/P60 family protein [Mordavella massiliensis]MBM6948828.1 C40 family peptidase [Mordavella massiliensis]
MRGKKLTAFLLSVSLVFGSAGTSLAAEPEENGENNITAVMEEAADDGSQDIEETEQESQDSSDVSEEQGDLDVSEEETAPEIPEGSGEEETPESPEVPENTEEPDQVGLSYRAHVQTYGWNEWTEEETGILIGTEGQAKRLEALELKVEDAPEGSGIEYRAHVQTYGWQDWKKDGETAGTTGQTKRLEAVRIRLTGALAEQYDIYYRAHVQSYGWLNWTCNGEKAGSLGYAKRLEAIEIRLVKKGAEVPKGEGESYKYPALSYQTHSQTIGWQAEKFNGETAGITGKSKRMEAIKIKLPDSEYEGGIEYQTHVQTYGWQGWKKDGELAGTTGQSKRLEAIQIRLTGDMAEYYDVYYRTHVQTFGWLDWAKNGEKAGSAGYGKRMEAIEIRLVKKGEEAPEQGGECYKYPLISYSAHSQSVGWQDTKWDDDIAGVTGKSKRMEAIKISIPDNEYEGGVEYRTFVQAYGWQDWKKDGEIAGTTNQAKRVEAVEIRLTGELAEHYDVYYSVHMAKIGWINYAVNGETAGSTDLSKRIEAIRIQLVEKGGTAPNTSGIKYIEGYKAADFTYSGTIQGTGDSGEIQMGGTLGTTGQSKRLENISLHLNRRTENMPEGQITYATHLSHLGWQESTGLDTVNGSTDGSYGIEAVKISLSGDLANYYDIYYRAHVQKYGWLGWAKNGQAAGTTKCGYRMEALQIKLVSKDASAPGPNSNYYTELKYRRYQNPSQYYQIKDSITLTGGGYTLSYGFEGVKVMKVIQALGLGNGIGMGGAFYGHNVENAVRSFQARSGLSQTGNVDLLTWMRMGFNQLQWEQWGAYVSPLKVNRDSTRADHIEAMISTAYSYLGTPYVIGAAGPPGTGIDCSGLVMQALYGAGLDISPINPVRHAHPGYEYESRNMWASSKFMHVPYSQRQRGDLIFYQNSSGVVIHVAIYLGNNQVIESWPNEVVVWPITNGQRSNIKGVVRPFV